MSRRGIDARARDRRHRAAVALRSRSSARGAGQGQPSSPDGERAAEQEQALSAEVGSTKHPTSWGSLRMTRPKRKARRRAVVDLDPLRQLVVGRDAAAQAVDVEVRRLRRFGAN
jgi:hypothetical protein